MPKRRLLTRAALALMSVVSMNFQVSATCFDHPENQIPACGFETTDEINQWIVGPGLISLTTSPVHSGFGAALVHSTASHYHRILIESICLTPSGSEPMGYGIYVFPVTGPIGCDARVFNCWDSECTSCGIVGGIGWNIPAGEWTLVTYGEASTNGRPFAKFSLSCIATAPFEAVVDDAFWGEGMVPVTLQTMVVE